MPDNADPDNSWVERATAKLPPADTSIEREVRRLKASLADDALHADVASWPPLTPSQRDRLAVLLRGGVRRDA